VVAVCVFFGAGTLEVVGVGEDARGSDGVALFFLGHRETVAQEKAFASDGGRGREVLLLVLLLAPR
jgi:hypothetical protein